MALPLAHLNEPFIMIDSDEDSARMLLKDILFYRAVLFPMAGGIAPCFLPAPESPEASGQRAEVIYRLYRAEAPSSIITSTDAIKSYVWHPDVLKENTLYLLINEEAGREDIKETLKRLGYEQVHIVTEKGQFSMRQWLLDVFPSTTKNPIRVEFFGDVIESLRVFDTETQRSISEITSVNIMPAKEPEEGISIIELIKGFKFFCSEGSLELIPENCYLLSRYAISGEGIDAGLIPISGLGILPEERKDMEGFALSIKSLIKENRIIIVSSGLYQAERLREILNDSGLIAPIVDSKELSSYEGLISITTGELSSGIFIRGLLILTETEIFRKPPFRAIKKSKVSGLIASLSDLNEGDYVVQKEHGIGRFLGLTRQTIEGNVYDLITIEYGEGDKLYLPLEAIGSIQKYHSAEGAVPKIDRLRTYRWQRTKERVRKKIKDMAEKLLRLYAEREVLRGFSFSTDTELHREFDSFFLYEETPDQLRAIDEIKKDMGSEKPMDRLLTGDVGYGKTEVAMRAAFRAVYDGKQVAVVVPTTLLCEQHMRTFKSRFSAFPVRIDYVSRFKARKARLKTIKAFERGEIDIIIGTHSLLKDINFEDLGLLIIDEEHRFGVRQKEWIKELKKGVDVLTMSATPIPRTLQMALSGIRQMSVIETPPEERLSVTSTVSVYNTGLIKSAIEREVQRGGQVFFVHNRIKDIMKMLEELRKLMPHLRIELAHGQMPERGLERVMLSFLNKEVDVLLTTAIIGSGLDIPTANTIILNMADRLGLADLYQLRGRVGRSSEKAFAYFLIHNWNTITEEARKRLQAIEELSYLGAGFRLAIKDLEIRGAGNLLGAEQSGYINTVGFDMYIEMLEEAVLECRGIKIKEKIEPRLNLKVNAYIPDSYIDDMMLRLTGYRRIASVKSPQGLEVLRAEMRDRFGAPPEEFENLLRIMELKLMAEELLITAIKQSDGKVRFTFSKEAEISPERILEEFKGRVRFFEDGFELSINGEVYEEIHHIMDVLKVH